jgi:hypothetical protein
MSRWRRVVVAALIVGGLARLLFLDWVGAIAVALVVAALGLAVQRLDTAAEPWRWLPGKDPREGERREAMLLTWALAGRDGRVGERALRQIQRIGAHRLARHGLDVSSPADEDALRALVGPRALATLRWTHQPPPRLSDVDHTVAALDRIGPGHLAGITTSSRSNPR